MCAAYHREEEKTENTIYRLFNTLLGAGLVKVVVQLYVCRIEDGGLSKVYTLIEIHLCLP